jgi:alpha-D-ribose 1-methylphosphonate 5-phosphate C-P lyase
MVEEHLLGKRGALAKREQLEHLVFLAGQVHPLAANLNGLGVQVDLQFAGNDDRLRMPLGAAHDGMNAGNQFVLVERLGHVVVGTEADRLTYIVPSASRAPPASWRAVFKTG